MSLQIFIAASSSCGPPRQNFSVTGNVKGSRGLLPTIRVRMSRISWSPKIGEWRAGRSLSRLSAKGEGWRWNSNSSRGFVAYSSRSRLRLCPSCPVRRHSVQAATIVVFGSGGMAQEVERALPQAIADVSVSVTAIPIGLVAAGGSG